MPEMDGYEMCQKLKSSVFTRDIPLIFLTANNSTEDETKALEIGAVDFIPKPINPPVVIARVNTHLRLREYTENLKTQNRLLEENSKMKEDIELLARHDMKSPLQAVISVPPLIMDNPHLTDDEKEMLDLIVEAGEKLLYMINSSLDIYKMEMKTYSYVPQPVECVAVLRKADLMLANIRQSNGITFQMNPGAVDAQLPVLIQAEEMLLFSLFSNLLKNAYEAAPRGTIVEANARKVADAVHISITNSGEVPVELRGHFFQKYATSGKKQGTGLGTYSAYLITKTMNGEIALYTDQPNATTITLRFPSGGI